MTQKFLETYTGQTTEQLIGLENEYRTDSLVLAFEQAPQQNALRRQLSRAEQYVLAVEALEREVNNGGYSQFCVNSSNEFLDVIEPALQAIGCPKTAQITGAAIAALSIEGEVTGSKAEAAVLAHRSEVLEALDRCDDRYFENDEPIAAKLFAWIKQNAGDVRANA
jgi:hypothetical protein